MIKQAVAFAKVYYVWKMYYRSKILACVWICFLSIILETLYGILQILGVELRGWESFEGQTLMHPLRDCFEC